MASVPAAIQRSPRKVLKKPPAILSCVFLHCATYIDSCVFTLVPMVFAIALAFCAWDGRHAIEFIGLKNFVKLFHHR